MEPFAVKRARRSEICVMLHTSSSFSVNSGRPVVLNEDPTTHQKDETPKELQKLSLVLKKPVPALEASSSSPLSQDKCQDLRKKYDDFGNSLFQEWQESQEKHKAEREEFEKEKQEFEKEKQQFEKEKQQFEKKEEQFEKKKERFTTEKLQFVKDLKQFTRTMQVIRFLEDEILEKNIDEMDIQTIQEEMKYMKEKRDLWNNMKIIFDKSN